MGVYPHKPTQMEAFDALYGIAAAGGRGEALFGDSIELARPAYARTLATEGYPNVYLEFPLLGEPCFDLLSVHHHVRKGARFVPGAGYGYQDMLDWYAGACPLDDGTSCGIELDVSSGETERAGVYLQQRGRHELVAPFLASVGERDRASSYRDVASRLPQGWPPSYVGLFPGRVGTPLRIGGYMDGRAAAHCVEDPAYLGDCFRQVGFSAYDGPMLARCAELMRHVPSVDFQFDIMGDGSLGDTFGLSLSLNEAKPREASSCMDTGYGAELMRLLEGFGLADGRWRHIAGAVFARHVGYAREDGSEGRFALTVRLNYAKVKFTACEPRPAKFYLLLSGSVIEV